tara:strand:- start:3720 stop:5402 length:1683 start_codon:yes stop_codon:yes gene_type:complete
MKTKRWKIKKNNILHVKKLAQELSVNDIIANLLVSRGVESFNEAKNFFRPKLSDLHDPFLMQDMEKAVDRIKTAISKKQKILIYGDYDVDGATSVAMMYSFLKKYNTNVEYYIPCRYNEGYGISFKSIDYAHKKNVSLVITLDCGIRDVDQVDYAKEKKIEFIICDHHNPSKKIPRAIAVLNPKQFHCKYPYKQLSGCGVGFKLIQAYSIKNNIPFEEIMEYLDLLTISIGADIVPINGENRILAFYGLKKINMNPSTSIKVLLEAFCKKQEISMSDIVFGIAPRINAAGRIQHAKKAVEILVEKNYDKIKLLAEAIEENNIKRKKLDKSITKEALRMIDKTKKSTVVYSGKWHKGVVGIVASRLIEKHYKPTIVLTEDGELFTGSARSVHDFDIYAAISKCSHLCEKFGGHKYAAGISVKKENIEEFVFLFEKVVASKITQDQMYPKIDVDMEIDVNDIDNKLYRIIKQFSPFGPGNLPPVFVSRGVADTGYAKQVGEELQHLRLNIKKQKGSIACIGFSMGEFFENTKNNQNFDICYRIHENHWNGQKNLQLECVDLK